MGISYLLFILVLFSNKCPGSIEILIHRATTASHDALSYERLRPITPKVGCTGARDEGYDKLDYVVESSVCIEKRQQINSVWTMEQG